MKTKNILLGLALGCLATSGHTAEWAVGAGLGSLGYNVYPGSRDYQVYPVLTPHLIYRSERLSIDPQGARAELVRTRRAVLDVSLGASLPVDSDQASAREGMPDLDAVVEAGPSLEIDLAQRELWNLRLKLQARSAFALDSGLPQVGWRASPHLDLEHAGGDTGWRLRFKLGADWVDKDMAGYYYNVNPEHALPWRPAFVADGGYAGSWMLAGASRYLSRNIWMGGFVHYRNLSGASFADSPLVETQHAFSAGFVVAYLFARSDGD